jgi:hypothetical protein
MWNILKWETGKVDESNQMPEVPKTLSRGYTM